MLPVPMPRVPVPPVPAPAVIPPSGSSARASIPTRATSSACSSTSAARAAAGTTAAAGLRERNLSGAKSQHECQCHHYDYFFMRLSMTAISRGSKSCPKGVIPKLPAIAVRATSPETVDTDVQVGNELLLGWPRVIWPFGRRQSCLRRLERAYRPSAVFNRADLCLLKTI